MVNSKINQNLIPQVNKLPKKEVGKAVPKTGQNEFDKIFQEKLAPKKEAGLHLSKHAQKRIEDRSLNFDQNEFIKLKDAIGKLKDKGGKDSLVVTNNNAYIVDVNNEKVVTAMKKEDMNENVFTKIDSTMFIN